MSERLEQSDDREALIRTALTEDIERWQCMSEFTESRIFTAARKREE
jgi:hypothetical protein